MGTNKQIRWTHQEMEILIPEIIKIIREHHLSLTEAAIKAQQILPESRRRPAASIKNGPKKFARPFDTYLKARRAKRIKPAFPTLPQILAGTELAPKVAVKKKENKHGKWKRNVLPSKPEPCDSRPKNIRWSKLTIAQVAAEVDTLMSDGQERIVLGKPWRLWHYVAQAQANILSPELQRPYGALNQAAITGHLQKQIEQGRADRWLLEPIGTVEDPAPDEPAPAPDEPPSGPATPLPGPSATQAALQDSIAAMLRAHTAYLAEEVFKPMMADLIQTMEIRILRNVQGIKESMGQELNNRIHAQFEQELGPKTVAPAIPEPAPVIQPGKDSARLLKLALDVVGLLPGQAQIVKKELPENFDVRFITNEDALKVTPRKFVIAVTKFIGHPQEQRYKNANAELIRVNGAAQSVISAIRNLDVTRQTV